MLNFSDLVNPQFHLNIIFLRLFVGGCSKSTTLKSFISLAKKKKNYYILNSSLNDDSLENKIYEIVKKYLMRK